MTQRRWCPLLSNKGLWGDRLRWLKSAWNIWWCWYGSLRYVHVFGNVFVSLSLWVFVCVCELQCKNVFSYALCVFDRDERVLCSHVCWQEVRHSCTRLQLVSVRILCSFASKLLFSFPLLFLFSFQSLGIGSVCFYFTCLISSFTSSFLTCICPISSLNGSMTEKKSCVHPPHCVPFDPSSLPILHQTPKGGQPALFAFDLATN